MTRTNTKAEELALARETTAGGVWAPWVETDYSARHATRQDILTAIEADPVLAFLVCQAGRLPRVYGPWKRNENGTRASRPTIRGGAQLVIAIPGEDLDQLMAGADARWREAGIVLLRESPDGLVVS